MTVDEYLFQLQQWVALLRPKMSVQETATMKALLSDGLRACATAHADADRVRR
jgi:hypothetical protein